LFDLYFAVDYKNKLIKKLINNFKNYPYVQQLAQPLALLIVNHFQLIDNKPDFSGFILIAMPVSRKELKKRGFNQAELLAKNLSLFLEIPLLTNCLIKLDQTKNLNQSFEIKNINLIKDKNILLVDDYY
jgi:competence protein ComFC